MYKNDLEVGYTRSAGSSKRGWYITLPDEGERVIDRALVKGELVYFNTVIPDTSTCDAGGKGWENVVQMANGGSARARSGTLTRTDYWMKGTRTRVSVLPVERPPRANPAHRRLLETSYLAHGPTKSDPAPRREHAITLRTPRSLPLLPVAPPGASPGRNCIRVLTDLITSLDWERRHTPRRDQTLFLTR
ncbi:MAG: hypothetical protein CM1200mP41_25350 [Gammaproteobacteria bacterium]|nr:MAG: hypothetical protein CM1200mP41_25350 [Gammaproteobacteria bacterium]